MLQEVEQVVFSLNIALCWLIDSLHSWRYCVLGEGDLAAEPLYQSSESWRRSRHERRSREKYRLPENHDFSNAAHFYRLN